MSFDPAETRRRREAAAAEADKAPPLEPPFPWNAVPFPATSFVPDPDPPAVDSAAASEIP